MNSTCRALTHAFAVMLIPFALAASAVRAADAPSRASDPPPALVAAPGADAPVTLAATPAPERDLSGSVLFHGGGPLASNGFEVVGSIIADDFKLESAARVQAVRYWTIDSIAGVADGAAQYGIYSNSGGEPGSLISTGTATVIRTATGRTPTIGSNDFVEYVNEIRFQDSVEISAGHYWLALHVNESCSQEVGIFWETGDGSYSGTGHSDPACDESGWTDLSVDFAFMIIGTTTTAPVDLAHPSKPPFLTNDLFDGSDRGIAVEMKSRTKVSSLGILADVGSAATLTVAIRSISDTTVGGLLASGSAFIVAGGPGFFDVPVNFTFEQGLRYQIAFNITGGLIDNGSLALEFFNFDNKNLLTASGYQVGGFLVLDGFGPPLIGESNPYTNTVTPHIRATLSAQPFDAYGLMVDSVSPDQYLVGFNLAQPQDLTLVAPLPIGNPFANPETTREWPALDIRPGGGLASAYILDATNEELDTINLTTGVIAKVKTLSPTGSEILSGMAFDPTTGLLYITASDTSASSLYEYNFDGNSFRRQGRIQGSRLVVGIAIDQTGTLYGIDVDNDSLFTIDKSNGDVTVIGDLDIDISFSQGMDFEPATGKLVAALFVGSSAANRRGELHLINTTTGAATLIGTLGSNYPGGRRELSSIAIANDTTAFPSPTPTVTPSPTVSPTPAPNDAAVLGTNLGSGQLAGQYLSVGIDVQNTGQQSWSAAQNYLLGITSDPCGAFGGATRIALAQGAVVANGETVRFTVPAIVPSAACSFTVRMIQEGGGFFGSEPTFTFTPGTTGAVDFTAGGGDAAGWIGGVNTGDGSTALGAAGLCMSAPATGDNVVLWVSPERYLSLKDNNVYRIRATASTDQTGIDQIPFWVIDYDNFNANGLGNTYGGQGWFLDVADGANGVGRPNGRTQFEVWSAPNAAITKQWRGQIGDGTLGALNPLYDTINDTRIIVRIVDLGSAGINANIDSGSICIQSLAIDSFDITAIDAQTPSAYSPPIRTTTHSPFTNGQAPLFAEINDTAEAARYQLGTTEDRATLIPAINPYNLPDLYPIVWNDNELFRVTATIGMYGAGLGTDPPEAVGLNIDTVTNELGAVAITLRGGPGNMDRCGSPRMANVTGTAQPYIAFFYTHNRTDLAELDVARFRPQVDFFNSTKLYGDGQGGDNFEVTTLRVDRMVQP